MYTACTFRLTQVLHAELLSWLPGLFVYIALAAWLTTLGGLIHHLLQSRLRPRATQVDQEAIQ